MQRDKDYDKLKEKEAREWMEAVLQEDLEGEFFESIHDGSYLCRLFNKLFPLDGANTVIKEKHTVKPKAPFQIVRLRWGGA